MYDQRGDLDPVQPGGYVVGPAGLELAQVGIPAHGTMTAQFPRTSLSPRGDSLQSRGRNRRADTPSSLAGFHLFLPGIRSPMTSRLVETCVCPPAEVITRMS